MKKLKLWLIFVMSISVIFIVNKQAYAVSLVYDTSIVASGTQYDFTLTNDDIIPDIFELFVHTPVSETNFVSFGSPIGWGDGFGGTDPNHGPDLPLGSSFVEWFADFGQELSLGDSLPGFSFVSSVLIPDSITFSINQDSSVFYSAIPNGVNNNVIPEPASMLLFSLGVLGFGLFKRTKYSFS